MPSVKNAAHSSGYRVRVCAALVGRLGVIAAAVAAALVVPTAARANDPLGIIGSSTSNVTIDVIFWGPGITNQDQQDVTEYVTRFCDFLNGATPAGEEAALHWYGLSGCVPGLYTIDTNYISSDIALGNCCNPDEVIFANEVSQAHNGSFGAVYNFANAVVGNALPSGPTRLAVVMTRGTNMYAQVDGQIGHPGLGVGLHSSDGGTPWAAAMIDPGGLGSRNFSRSLSHEIIESMTDLSPWDGWVTSDQVLGVIHGEACDECIFTAPDSPTWIASTGDNISGISPMTLDPGFVGINNIGGATCQLYEPEEFAPMAATLNPTRGGLYIDFFYRTPTGHLVRLVWSTPTGLPGGPVDLGPPRPTGYTIGVTARGKPSAVHGFGPDDSWVFVRGSDNGVWVYSTGQGQWTPLGGVIFGDPGAVSWDSGQNLNGGGNINVFGVGTDDNLYTYGFTNSGSFSWAPLGNNNVFHNVIGSPKPFTHAQATVDVFAQSQNLAVEWAFFSTDFGWGQFSDSPQPDAFSGSPIGIAAAGPNRIDIATSNGGVYHATWTGDSGYYGSWTSPEQITPLIYDGGFGTPALVSWGPGRLDVFVVNVANQLQHAYKSSDTDSWHGDTGNPMASDAVGDPVVVSRGPGQLDIFYRTTMGSLSHLNFTSGPGWTTQSNVIPQGSIQ